MRSLARLAVSLVRDTLAVFLLIACMIVPVFLAYSLQG